MANELSSLTEFTRSLFKHAFMFLPWFGKNCEKYQYQIKEYEQEVISYIDALYKDKPLFFGEDGDLKEANSELDKFYAHIKPYGDMKANAKAIEYYINAWSLAWKNRTVFQLRGHEGKMMKYFHEIISGKSDEHLAELISMARLVSMEMVKLARLIVIPNGWTAKGAFNEKTRLVQKLQKKAFGDKAVSPENSVEAHKKRPKAYKKYQKAVRDRKQMALLRMTEIFDENHWYPIIDSATLHYRLKEEGLEEFLPLTYRGRVGVQPSGYPLTFYTYAGLELEAPPLNEVEMNMDYGKEEKDKDYKIHPVSDGTFYCQSKAMVGDTKTKYYTLAYKRRARRLKYDQVEELGKVIDKVREKLIEHIHCDDHDTRVRALICLFIDFTCARIGNIASTKGKKKTFGVTTLLTKKHVHVEEDKIIIKYMGKHLQQQKHVFNIYKKEKDKKEDEIENLITEALLELIKEDNVTLFARANGRPVTPQMVNEYFTGNDPDCENGLPYGGAGSPCTVHSMRNYHATRVFRELVEKFNEKRKHVKYEDLLAEYQGKNKTKSLRGHKGILEKIAKMLGNTPAICRKAYIDPKDQIMFFKRWGYRPPDCIIKDLFVDEAADTYGIDRELEEEKIKFIYAEKRAEVAKTRRKVKDLAAARK